LMLYMFRLFFFPWFVFFAFGTQEMRTDLSFIGMAHKLSTHALTGVALTSLRAQYYLRSLSAQFTSLVHTCIP